MNAASASEPRSVLRWKWLGWLLTIEVAVLLFARYIGTAPGDYVHGDFALFAGCFGVFSVVALIVTAGNTFGPKRKKQALEPLRTDFSIGRETLLRRARAWNGVALFLAVPLLTILGYEMLFEYFDPHARVRPGSDPAWVYAVCSLLTVLVYFPLVKWMVLWIGLRARSRLGTIVISLCVAIAWCVLPCVVLTNIIGVDVPGPASWLYFGSPIIIPEFNGLGGLNFFAPGYAWLPVFVNFAHYGAILFLVRHLCLKQADEHWRGQGADGA